jgi:acetolactate synthase small subunit
MFRPDRLSINAGVACEAGSANQSVAAVFCFSIDVVPDPGTMARVLEQFAKRGLVPTRWHSDVVETDAMQIDIQIVGLSAALGQDIARCLQSIVGVHSVLTAGKTGGGKATHIDRRLRSL